MMIKTWQERQAESTEEWNEMPPPKWVFMKREIEDLRSALAAYENRSASDRQMHIDWDKYETDLAVKTLNTPCTPENKAFYEKIDREIELESEYMSYLEAGGSGEPLSFDEWRAMQ